MALLSKLFGSSKPAKRATTASDPLRIAQPIIGFLNLQGERANVLMESDRSNLAPLFKSAHVSADIAPLCQVLFIYCTIGPNGELSGTKYAIRELVKAAGAYIAVIASENDVTAYSKTLGPRNDWGANIVMVVERKGDNFPSFFRNLFTAMFNGESMLMAWVKLAPQIPGHMHPNAPSALVAAEAGHITFK